MTNEMKLQNEVLSMEELDEVNGGTVAELNELARAFIGNNKILSAFEDVREFASEFKLGCLTNIPLAYAMEAMLKNDLHIYANISVGWLGTGFKEKSNVYATLNPSEIASGKIFLSHADVVQRVKAYGNATFC